jgi:Na+-translocating ferredoxin:NAD+ oxidoreductase RnfC subunit
LSDPIRNNGVVGSGGAGFPTAVKLSARVSTFIVNAAECEPLLHKDKELLLHRSEEMLQGLVQAMRQVGATRGIIGIKKKYENVIQFLTGKLPEGVEICQLGDTYPAGDEFVLVHEVTGKIIPPGGLPKDVDTVVTNVETLVNVGAGKPVTHKYLTVGGAVENPVSLRVPIGMSFREVIAAAGGSMVHPYEVVAGGVMMGRLVTDLDEPVTKTTGGLLIFPSEHPVIQRHQRSWKTKERIGKSACDQCSFCTELCPRYLLGHPIQPHAAMRALGFAPESARRVVGTLYCCECRLCQMVSCPEGLDPASVCAQLKPMAREKGLKWTGDSSQIQAHPLAKERRTPTRRLMSRLGLHSFRNIGPLDERDLMPKRVMIPLKQHVGAPSVPVVKVGDSVREGQLVAAIPEKALGSNIHASISGTVESIENGSVVISRTSACPHREKP